ncbi:hypothetical protein BLS_007034 [Venturia inaequalis]|uniref:Uncharacterized protein n=1 Tax=Venturia inaequalis TaxID=5025 RepID=A0A8H3YXB0_VENIN|nr:hypothetical protein BLS_007034 [Venturia inaequalis]KAE9973167.1 hypothetical protein EG327_009254 [Venturia inaequalis]
MVSPSFTFNCPPPPPYSQNHASSASAPSSAGLPPPNNLISPPGSRRTSGDDQPPPPPPPSAPRQSLPSIFEALGGSDLALAYPTQQPGPPSSAPGPAFFQTPTSSSADIQRRPTFTSGPTDLHRPAEPHHPAELPKSGSGYRPTGPTEPHRFSQVPPPQSPYMGRPSPQQGHGPPTPTSQTHSEGRPPYPPQPRLPSLHPIRTGNSPVATPRTLGYPPSQQPSPGYEPTPPSAPGPYNGYSQYGPPNYQYPQATSGPVYTPSAASAAPPRYPASQPAWAPAHDYHNGIDERGETVKRHLDTFELEASLNEIAECSGKMLEFSREYGSRAHPNQRTGLSPSSIPHLQTVDELLARSDKLRDSLLRIRDVVEQQHADMEDQMKDPNRDSHMRYASEANASYSDKMEGSGGFANGEGKKRRGRAAPPGRYYAKLTRKMGANKAAIGTSNLRPKSLGPGSPGA